MTDHPRLSKFPLPDARVVRAHWCKRAVLALIFTVAGVLPASLTVLTQNAFAGANVNFIGTWIPSLGAGQRWTVKSENPETGRCTGTSALSVSGYHFTNCKVTGNKYSFWITLGSYKSHNSGTIAGNTLKGGFRDGNGTATPYTAKRKK